jgi:aminomethyltransferase
VRFEGPDALKNLNRLLTTDFSGMAVGQALFADTERCRRHFGRFIVYRLAEEKYLAVVNASNREMDVLWIRPTALATARCPTCPTTLRCWRCRGRGRGADRVADPRGGDPQSFTGLPSAPRGRHGCLLSRTGYTGEFGYELYVRPEDAPTLWMLLLEKGREAGLIPCGLGARDTLRLEAAMPLYGHEMDECVSPLETGLDWAVKADGHDFIGREAMLEKGAPRMRVGLKAAGKGILREHQTVFRDGRPVGQTTSGTFLPHVGAACAMALVERGSLKPDDRVEVDVRGRMVAADVVPLPFYNRAK